MAFRFSVVIPSYNRASLLPVCLGIFLTPAAAGLEVIVVDDGSTDDSLAVAQRLATSSKGAQIKVVHQANGGISAARNRGVAEVSTPWVTFLDTDDLWFDWSIDAVESALKNAGSAGLVFLQMRDFVNLDELDVLTPAPLRLSTSTTYLELYAQRLDVAPEDGTVLLGGCNVAMRRDLLLSVGGFDNGVKATEDQDTFLRIGPDHKALALLAPVIMGHRVAMQDSLSTNWSNLMTGLDTVLCRWRAGRYPGPSALVRRCVALSVRIAMWRMIAAGERATVIRLLRRETLLLARVFGWRHAAAGWRDVLLGRR